MRRIARQPPRRGPRPLAAFVAAIGILLATTSYAQTGETPSNPARYDPKIPRTWADEAVKQLELPLAHPKYSPQHVSEEYYYQLPVRPVWKSYPIYHPDHEPPGYREKLAGLEPEVAFDPAKLVTEQDWIDAGAEIFRAPIAIGGPTVLSSEVLDPAWYERNGIGLTPEGTVPYLRWVIREKGKIEVGNQSCAMCHTRLMPDGSVIEGAQGNFPFEKVIASAIRYRGVPRPVILRLFRQLTTTPWNPPDSFAAMSNEQLAVIREASPSGVIPRQGTSFQSPVRIPDLIGIQDRKYLDASGLVIHRGIGDLMRYAALNQGLDLLARFGDFVPITLGNQRPPPGKGRLEGTNARYSDEQLFALAKFLYALKPPANPNPVDELARRGEQVFQEQSCGTCHTPPLYTNNQLIPAPGFDPPQDHYDKYDVFKGEVGTDPELTRNTRRGTGYYKVPSLKGVWYRGPLGHSGWVATLEDWFDPARLSNDYVPTGFAGTGGLHAVPGHPFGLGLPDGDKQALLAFLRTL
jgi:mono/diheme cytochrome c family protein